MNKRVFIFTLLLVSLTSKAFADINISASVDKNIVSLDEQITLQVVISGNVTNIPQPQLPPLDAFHIYSAGRSQSISIINGQVSSSISFNYVLTPRKIGEFEIPPITVTYQGKTYQTNPIKIKVEKARGSPQQLPLQKDVYRGAQRDIFVETTVDKKTAYVDEQITLTFRFFTKVNLLSQPQYIPPDTTGFIKEDLPPQKNYYTIINGQKYYVSEIKTALFPTTAGKFVIGPATVKCVIEDFDIDDFFSDNFFRRFFSSGREIVLKSQPIEITVLPLPKPEPKNFYGSVGYYKISASVDKQTLQQNETTFLNLKVSGTGNVKSITIPKEYIQQLLGHLFVVYEPVVSYDMKKENYLVKGSKTFKIPITPKVPGTITIPQISFVYFNPDTKQYETTTTDKLEIQVIPQITSTGNIRQQLQTGLKQAQEKISFEDIKYIKTTFTVTKSKRIKHDLYAGVQIVPVLLWLCVTGFVKYRTKVTKNIHKYRATKALKLAIRRLKTLKPQSQQFISELYDIVAEYISSKMYTSKESLSIQMIRQYLENKISAETLSNLLTLWDELNFYRFAPVKNVNFNPKEWIAKTKQILQKLEYELQKR